MDSVALIFLSDDRDTQRLAVAWPKVGRTLKRKVLDQVTVTRWSELSGVHIYAVQRLGPVLLEHDICKLNGTTDENALAFIRRLLAKSVTRRGRPPTRS